MITAKLKSSAEAEKEIAKIFQAEISENDVQFTISVRDEGAFTENGWLQLGTVRLPLPALAREWNDLEREAYLTGLVKLGAFEWITPASVTVKKELLKLLTEDNKNKKNNKLDRILDSFSSIAVRTGLLQPLFDPAALKKMPYNRPTTVVADTSGVLQGGLNFVARYLHPFARVKIPAIVHMELVASADNFFRLRHSPKKKTSAQRQNELKEHLKSQGGQRALLRLELQTDIEIERTFLLGDPLRNAFRTDTRNEVRELNLTLPMKSYADRLILEAARHHQAQSGPTHQIRLLTCDQGLARMALAEGIIPLYFSATKATIFFDTRLTGRTFDPFTGEVQEISLALVLWELATAFGSVRLKGRDDKTAFTISALGKEMPWAPYHSLEDLLWCTSTVPIDEPSMASGYKKPVTSEPEFVLPQDKPVSTQNSVANQKITFFRFDVERLFRLICVLDDNQVMTVEDILEFLGIKNLRGLNEYRRFLLSASLVSIDGQTWHAKPSLDKLSAALRNERIEDIRNILLSAPSFAEFTKLIAGLEIGQPLERSLLKRATSTYRILGEITLICAEVRGEGIYPTPTIPNVTEFASLALERYSELESGDGLVATGDWLESLIRDDGIHPEIARARLNEASEKGFLRRSTEGSTMQIRHDDHILHVLGLKSGLPIITPIHLYRGDYLIPGKASVSLRIEDAQQ